MKTLKMAAATLMVFGMMATTTASYAGGKGKKMKKHTCTEACKKEGKCVMAHGEKGHSCTDACKKEESGKKKM